MKSLEKLAKMNWIEQNFIFRIIEIRKVIGGVMESCGEKIHFSLESIRNICLISKGFYRYLSTLMVYQITIFKKH